MASRNHTVTFKGVLDVDNMQIKELERSKGEIIGEKDYDLKHELSRFDGCEVKISVVEQFEFDPESGE